MTQTAFVRLMPAACAAVALLLGTGTATAGEEKPPATAKIRTPHQYVYIVYFNPAGRECAPGYRERLDRAMTTIQTWFRDEMERNGFGPMTFPLERDEDGRLVIHVVESTRAYGPGDEITADTMREQVKGPMLERGIDIDQEYIIILANSVFITEQDGVLVTRSWSHYVGRGRYRHGTAFTTDCELVDPQNVDKTEPTILNIGRYEMTAGRYVRGAMGGISHEFGHALGLPHNMQTDEQLAELGYTLMGRGNYSFLGKRGGEEHGAHLSKAHATILSRHPVFRLNGKSSVVEGEADVYRDPGVCRFHDIEFAPGNGEYIITGRVETSRPAYAVVAYHDLQRHHTDYDATSWAGELDEDGRFEVHVGALKPGSYELRLRCFLIDGSHHQLGYRFTLDPTLKIPAAKLKRQTLYELYAKPAIEARDPDALRAAVDEKLKGFNDVYYRRARAYYHVMTRTPAEPVELGTVPLTVRRVPLSSVKWASAEVGWAEPKVDHMDDIRPLESGEQFHERGLYAHANSRYVYNLNGRWKRFTSAYGLQNLHEGSVVFIVKCDGQERFRSELIDDWVEGQVEVDLTGVRQLELIVTDGGNGGWADCGQWFSPMLTR